MAKTFKVTYKDITTKVYLVRAENKEEAETLATEEPDRFLHDTFVEFESKVEEWRSSNGKEQVPKV